MTDIPRMRINHKSGLLEDGEFSANRVTCIILGVIRQRRASGDGITTECVSPNYEVGYPTQKFDWMESNFDPKQYPADEDGLIQLPCGSCNFANFGTGLGMNSRAPRCSEQHTYTIMYWPASKEVDESAITRGSRIAVITFQKSGLKASRAYMDTFKKAKLPAYTAITELRLSRQSRGGNFWSVPEFRKVQDSKQDNWPLFSAEARSARLVIQAPPTVDEDGRLHIAQSQPSRPGSSFEGIL